MKKKIREVIDENFPYLKFEDSYEKLVKQLNELFKDQLEESIQFSECGCGQPSCSSCN